MFIVQMEMLSGDFVNAGTWSQRHAPSFTNLEDAQAAILLHPENVRCALSIAVVSPKVSPESVPNPDVLLLKNENGKSITVAAAGADIGLIVWRKGSSVLLPLVMNRMEAQRLRVMLDTAITAANVAARS